MSEKSLQSHHRTNTRNLHIDVHHAVNEQLSIQQTQQELKRALDSFAETFTDDPEVRAQREEREHSVAVMFAEHSILRQYFEPTDNL